MPRSTLRNTPRDVSRKTRGQDGVAFSFPVGLLHPLQHAGLSRRTPCNALRVLLKNSPSHAHKGGTATNSQVDPFLIAYQATKWEAFDSEWRWRSYAQAEKSDLPLCNVIYGVSC